MATAPPPTYLPGRRTAGKPDPAEVITVTIGGRTFRAGRRTAAHLLWTIVLLAKLHPGARLEVIQGCYNTGVELSAYTHDYDGVLDVRIVGLEWRAAERFLRMCGWAAWWRHTGSWASSSKWHVHMASLGCPGPVGLYVPGQVLDYYHRALGLKGEHDSGDDPTWHPGDLDPHRGTAADIDATVFDYPAWVAQEEDNMPWSQWPESERQEAARDIAATVAPEVVKQLLAALVDNAGTTVKAALRKSASVPKLIRELAAAGFGPKTAAKLAELDVEE